MNRICLGTVGEVSNVFLCTLTNVHASVGRPARTDVHLIYVDTGCYWEDLPWDRWPIRTADKRVKGIHTVGTHDYSWCARFSCLDWLKFLFYYNITPPLPALAIFLTPPSHILIILSISNEISVVVGNINLPISYHFGDWNHSLYICDCYQRRVNPCIKSSNCQDHVFRNL